VIFKFSSLQKLTKLKENVYEMYATGCHQIPGILIATLAAFVQLEKRLFA
jgi:CRISPR/Cas system CMR-associated protein Cmr5 small subunit